MDDAQPLKPANILNIVAINQGRRPLSSEMPEAEPLAPQAVSELMEAGHIVVDARSSAEFGSGHIRGAYSVQMASSEFEQRVGWVTPDNAPLILVTPDAAAAQRCLYNMAFIGLDVQVAGYLDGGMSAWTKAGHVVGTVPQMDVRTLGERLSANGLQVLDVRARDEWDEGHIEGAEWMRFTDMAPQLDVPGKIDQLTLSRDRPIAAICGTGQRSSTAISMMLRHGYEDLYNVTGGMEAWKAARLPMVDANGQACEV